jgi:hypothetical protein
VLLGPPADNADPVLLRAVAQLRISPDIADGLRCLLPHRCYLIPLLGRQIERLKAQAGSLPEHWALTDATALAPAGTQPLRPAGAIRPRLLALLGRQNAVDPPEHIAPELLALCPFLVGRQA